MYFGEIQQYLQNIIDGNNIKSFPMEFTSFDLFQDANDASKKKKESNDRNEDDEKKKSIKRNLLF